MFTVKNGKLEGLKVLAIGYTREGKISFYFEGTEFTGDDTFSLELGTLTSDNYAYAYDGYVSFRNVNFASIVTKSSQDFSITIKKGNEAILEDTLTILADGVQEDLSNYVTSSNLSETLSSYVNEADLTDFTVGRLTANEAYIEGALDGSNSPVIYVGQTRDIKTLAEAITTAQKRYIFNQGHVNIFLDNFEADGTTQAVYTLDGALNLTCCNLVIRSTVTTGSTYARINGTNNASMTFREGSSILMNNLDIYNVVFGATQGSTLQMLSCKVYVSGNANAYSISYNAMLYLSSVTLDGGTTAPCAISCVSHGICQIRSSTVTGFTTGLNASYGSFIRSVSTTYTNVTTTANPASNTVGQHNSYVFIGS